MEIGEAYGSRAYQQKTAAKSSSNLPCISIKLLLMSLRGELCPLYQHSNLI